MTKDAGQEPLRSKILKNVFATKPWLFITASNLYSNPGLTMEELKEVTGLVMDVLKRSVWWLKKYGVVEEKDGKYFLGSEYVKPMEELRYNYCNLGKIHVLLLDKVYIMLAIREGRIRYWSLPAEYYEKLLYYERLTGYPYNIEEISYILRVDKSTAKRVEKLRELLKLCKTSISPAR